METTRITILLFGIAKDIIKASNLELIYIKDENIATLKNRIITEYPQLGRLRSIMIAVNHKYADPSYIIQPQDEIAIIPPVSGG